MWLECTHRSAAKSSRLVTEMCPCGGRDGMVGVRYASDRGRGGAREMHAINRGSLMAEVRRAPFDALSQVLEDARAKLEELTEATATVASARNCASSAARRWLWQRSRALSAPASCGCYEGCSSGAGLEDWWLPAISAQAGAPDEPAQECAHDAA